MDQVFDRLGPASGMAFSLLFGISAVTADLWDPATDPNPSRSSDALARLFEQNRDDLQVTAYLTLLAAFFLLAFGAWLRDVFARAERARWLPDLILGGAAAASALFLVEVAFVLAARETQAYAEAPQLAKTWFVLSWNYANVFAAPALAVVGGASAAAVRAQLLPRWLTWFGAVLTIAIVFFILANMPGVATGVFVLWVLVTSTALLIRPPAARRSLHKT